MARPDPPPPQPERAATVANAAAAMADSATVRMGRETCVGEERENVTVNTPEVEKIEKSAAQKKGPHTGKHVTSAQEKRAFAHVRRACTRND
ncbi:hypothetical protein Cenrod_1002 [Candidatus Symbiobacter mobilis CR]|uniref:Uncharacterized protein n=1 Tax=Candidatus Symbiobacter mobilis CR TaxID=946483 RepID=U5N6E2_9BURK|nr:hypothetical protein Cenrod_1002 [Candidatus Symbiobacter mobilis CR]